jgi:prepilin-type N-terminal cleavage/methylation domain
MMDAIKLRKMGSVKNKGFTLIEAMVGTALFLIIFTSVFGAYRLAMMASSLSSCRVAAIAIGNSQIEKIRNLPYGEIGTKDAQLPRAAGKLDQAATEEINGVTFTILTEVRFIADETDGLGAADSCDLDYKQADVEVSWEGAAPGKTFFSTKVAPDSKVQEAQSCQSQPGGVLTVTVFDDGGSLVPSPEIRIVDLSTGIQAASATPETGRHSFPLSPQSYRVEVSKNDYSAARTYGSDEVAVPESPHPTVLQDSETPVSLSIDRVASISVEAIAPVGQGNFSDNFDDESLLAETSNVAVAAGNVALVGPPYSADTPFHSQSLPVIWRHGMKFNFPTKRPPGTEIRYQLLYYDGVDWVLIPDADFGTEFRGIGGVADQFDGVGQRHLSGD